MDGVSVVMSVYDEPDHVQKTIESVLKQKGVDFEFIIVSDGASEAVVELVKSYADDLRVRFIQQSNAGLTVALINGCSNARFVYIARIDAGDVMLDDRLRIQYETLQANPDIGIVTSWVTIQTEEGYFLYDLTFSNSELNQAIRALSVDEFRSPFHASVMFRKSVYFAVGGYRDSFYFAQDCDLWSRMIDCSKLKVIESVLTCGVFSATGISGKYASEQKKLLALILQSRKRRLGNMPDNDVLNQAYQLRPANRDNKPINKASNSSFPGLYFIAKVLTDNKSRYALVYWYRVLKCRPLSIKSWFFATMSVLYLFKKG